MPGGSRTQRLAGIGTFGVVVWLVACSRDHEKPSTPSEFQEQCESIASALRAALDACCGRNGIPVEEFDETEQRTIEDCVEEHENPAIEIDPSLDADCEAILRADYAACARSVERSRPNRDHPCFTRVTGLLPSGSTCAADVECAEGECIDGFCVAWALDGEPCPDPPRGCGLESFCSEAAETEGMCLPRSGAGEPCEALDGPPDAVPVGDTCTDGFFCEDGTCIPLRADGDLCSQNAFECASGSMTGSLRCGPRDMCAPWMEYG